MSVQVGGKQAMPAFSQLRFGQMPRPAQQPPMSVRPAPGSARPMPKPTMARRLLEARAQGRSRSPRVRNCRAVTAVPPVRNHRALGWEEHFSDEFGIPYYWNSITDESQWDPP